MGFHVSFGEGSEYSSLLMLNPHPPYIFNTTIFNNIQQWGVFNIGGDLILEGEDSSRNGFNSDFAR